MSKTELERVLSYLSSHPAELTGLERLEETEEAWGGWARERGFDLSREQTRELLDSRRELGEDELEQVAGGWDDGTGGSSSDSTSDDDGS